MKILHKDGRQEIYKGNVMQGYVDTDDFLYGIKPDGYAVFICITTHISEAIPELKKWKKQNAG